VDKCRVLVHLQVDKCRVLVYLQVDKCVAEHLMDTVVESQFRGIIW
jgi:hypothetical protein